MSEKSKRVEQQADIRLIVPAELPFANIAAQVAQGAGEAFGMPAEVGLAMALASEEVVAFVAMRGNRQRPVSVRYRDGRYRMILELSLAAADFTPRFFNVHRQLSTDNRDDIEELGLFLTARSVDTFSISILNGNCPGGLGPTRGEACR